MSDVNPELQKRLSSWREVVGVVEPSPDPIGESSINEAQVRQRQRRGASMCVTVAKEHDAFMSVLRAFVENRGDRDSNQQQRIEDMSAFILGVYEQYSAENLHEGLKNELGNLPKEVIQTITVPAPQPPKSWLQRALGI
jgi:hypothetical protein